MPNGDYHDSNALTLDALSGKAIAVVPIAALAFHLVVDVKAVMLAAYLQPEVPAI